MKWIGILLGSVFDLVSVGSGKPAAGRGLAGFLNQLP